MSVLSLAVNIGLDEEEEQPQLAPQPLSKPLLEDLDSCLLTTPPKPSPGKRIAWKSLRAERLKYKQFQSDIQGYDPSFPSPGFLNNKSIDAAACELTDVETQLKTLKEKEAIRERARGWPGEYAREMSLREDYLDRYQSLHIPQVELRNTSFDFLLENKCLSPMKYPNIGRASYTPGNYQSRSSFGVHTPQDRTSVARRPHVTKTHPGFKVGAGYTPRLVTRKDDDVKNEAEISPAPYPNPASPFKQVAYSPVLENSRKHLLKKRVPGGNASAALKTDNPPPTSSQSVSPTSYSKPPPHPDRSPGPSTPARKKLTRKEESQLVERLHKSHSKVRRMLKLE